MKVAERKEAIRLRRDEGLSLKEISDKLQVSKSSVSTWTRGITLTKKQEQGLSDRIEGYKDKQAGARKLRRMAKERSEKHRKEGIRLAEKSHRFGYLCALYWGEGGKDGSVFSVANCDYEMLSFIGRWLVDNGYEENISFRVQYYGENGVSEAEITEWWKARLPFLRDYHLRKFTQCKINRASQKKKIGSRPYGTATITVCRKELVDKIFGGIEFLKRV